MGSKGSNTTTTNQSQSYSANPAVANAGTQAIGMATNAANTPFNLPVAPVAGFTPQQQQAFQQYQNLQGMAQPYYNQAQTDIAGSAAPITGQDVSQYYNPMASQVLAQLRNTQGQQMNDVTGRLTQTAGGVGADRIAVGQSELANQQNLATGQVASGLYQNALNAAQQNKQMQANAGYGLSNLGTTAQNAALQGTGALNQAGNQQQAQAQAQLNAPYQNQLAQLAYPFQTAQYLAGITGGLSGALGGTTQGTGTTTGPSPSIWSQILGGLTGATGVAGSLGAFNSPSYGGGSAFSGDAYGGSASNPLASLTANDYGARGGRMNGYAAGGSVGSPMGNPDWMKSDPIVPAMGVQSQGNSGAKLNLSPAAPAQQNTGKDIGSSLASAAKMAAMFASQGGTVDPATPFQSFAKGGGMPDFDTRFSDAVTAMPYANPQADLPPPIFGADGKMMGNLTSNQGQPPAPPVPQVVPQPMQNMAASGPPRALAPPVNPSPPATADNTTSLDESLPYPDLHQDKDPSRAFAKNPWMALANAGFAMMAGTSPFAGVNIGKGLQAGVQTLEQQRKDLESEEGINQRAKQLIQQAKFHGDTIAMEKQKLALEREKMEEAGWKPTYDLSTGKPLFVNPRKKEALALDQNGKWISTTLDGTSPAAGVPAPAPTNVPGPDGSPQAIPTVAQPGQPAYTPPTKPASEVETGPTYLPNGQLRPELRAETVRVQKEAGTAAAAGADMKYQLGLMKEEFKNIDDVHGVTGYLLQPGTAAEFRFSVAKALNGMFGNNLIDKKDIGSAEAINKISVKLGQAQARLLGAREAAQIVQQTIKANPGLENTQTGRMNLISGMEQAAQRQLDYAKYVQQYMAGPGKGSATGAEAAFARDNPPEKYVAAAHEAVLPPQVKATLPQAVQILRQHADNPAAIAKFNAEYNGLADYYLGRH